MGKVIGSVRLTSLFDPTEMEICLTTSGCGKVRCEKNKKVLKEV